MKCRVCGYELGDDRSYCPMCGTKVYQEPRSSSASNAEIAWNTKDFPKPKQLEDIDMNWGSGFKSFMAQDASEGFVSVEKKEEKPVRPAGIDPFELPSQMKQSAQSAYSPNPAAQPSAFDTWKMPQQQPEPQMPLWYTQNFTATGVMKTGPAYPIAQNVPAQNAMPTMPNMQTPNAQTAAAALSAAMPDATIQFVKVDAPKPVYKTEPVYKPEPAYKTDYEAYKPDYDKIPAQATKAPEKFNTFMAKNAEFQALLDKEYERIHAQRAGEVSAIPSARTSELFTAETRVQAQSIDDFEKSIFGNYDDTEKDDDKKDIQKDSFDKTIAMEPAKAFSYDSDKTDLSLDELISDPLDPKFNIDTIEMTIKQLEEEAKEEEVERQQKLSRLEAMKAAREAYFKFLDEDGDGKIDEQWIPKDATVIADPSNAENSSDDDMKTWPSKEERVNTQELSDDFMEEDVTKLPDELVGLYKDDEEEEEAEEPKKKHGFLRFLFVLVLIVALFEGAVFGLQHFLPGAQITAQASAVQTAVVDALTNLYSRIAGLEF